jgi:lipopolysaccharide transport system ATP-binding protein
MSNTAIKVENLSKIYRLGEIGTGTISRDMERWFKTKVLKQEDPFLKIGETNDRANKGASDIVYSLQDINFEINQGDAVGIIGRNGAGKSTLLKILSRVTTPTTGRINIKGRVASLLEVGTGFHPELTGRENIYLNGAILGMRKREIDRKLDEIIDFSGVERYIDTPVKRYSSGMYVRLAFAVAAHLESEILIVDEVLAVGDAEFQKKCLGKMGEVSKGEGRTVLFVSHNMDAVRELTSNSILLESGALTLYSNTNDVIFKYNSGTTELSYPLLYNESNWLISKAPHLLSEIVIDEIRILHTDSSTFNEGEQLSFQLAISERSGKKYEGISVGMRIMNLADRPIGTWFSKPMIEIEANESKSICLTINELNFAPGDYYFTVWIGIGDYLSYSKDFYSVDQVLKVKIQPKSGGEVLPVWYEESWGYSIYKNLEIQ